MVRDFELCIRFSAISGDPAWDPLSLSLSILLSCILILSLSVNMYTLKKERKEKGLHCTFHCWEIWHDFSLYFMKQIFSGCFRIFFEAVCFQLLPWIHFSALLLFDIPVTLSSMFSPWERDGVGFTHSAHGRKNQSPVEYRLNGISHEQRYCMISEGQHGKAFLSVPTRIFFFHTQSCICYTCIKVQGIFPSNCPSKPITLTWDDLFRLAYQVFFSPWLFFSCCQIAYCQSGNRNLNFIIVVGTHFE